MKIIMKVWDSSKLLFEVMEWYTQHLQPGGTENF